MINTLLYYLRIIGTKGLVLAIAAKLLRREFLLQIVRDESTHPFYLRIPSSDVATYEQIILNEEYKFMSKEAPQVILDAGANIGLTALLFAARYRCATVIALEPDPRNFAALQRNVQHCKNIIPLHAALWDKNTTVQVEDAHLGYWGMMTREKTQNSTAYNQSGFTVPALTVNEIMNKYSLKKIDILKLDIEGSEKEVLENASSWIEHVNAIIVELHEHMRPGADRAFQDAAIHFPITWQEGENMYLSRGNIVSSS